MQAFFYAPATVIYLQILITKPFNQFIVHVEFGSTNAVG